jgi:hypothetical protein
VRTKGYRLGRELSAVVVGAELARLAIEAEDAGSHLPLADAAE